MRRSSPQKKFGMGHVKIHGFHCNRLYDSRDWGGGGGGGWGGGGRGRPTNSIISRVLLILEH